MDHKHVQQPFLDAIAKGLKTEEGRLMASGKTWEKSLEGVEMTLGDNKERDKCKILIRVRFGRGPCI